MAPSSSKKRKREVVDTSESVSFALADQPASQIGPVLGKYIGAQEMSDVVAGRKRKLDLTAFTSSQFSCNRTLEIDIFQLLLEEVQT
jgi:hypothetical protein